MNKEVTIDIENPKDNDLINRQAVLKQLKGCLTGGETEYQYVKLHIDSIPSVKPQERTGHWNLFHTTEHGMREDSYFKCNRCNYESYKEYNFCPNCGARMEVENNG